MALNQLSQPQPQYPYCPVPVNVQQPTYSTPELPDNWYRVKLLGRGGFGTVYLIRNANTGQLAAEKLVEIPTENLYASNAYLKSVLKTITENEVQALNTEINLLSSFSHERIVCYYGFFQYANTLSIIMEYMPGGSIRDQIDIEGPITELVARKYTRQILEGLVYLHSFPVIHRDIKCANVLRDGQGNVKICDFGGAKRLQTIKALSGQTIFGTRNWMSPEMISGKECGPKTDLWSLACTVVEMFTKNPPSSIHEAKTTVCSKLPPNISLNAESFLRRIFVDEFWRPNAELLLFTDPWFLFPIIQR